MMEVLRAYKNFNVSWSLGLFCGKSSANRQVKLSLHFYLQMTQKVLHLHLFILRSIVSSSLTYGIVF